MSTKQSIIEAATRLFADKGYEGMTMKEIAREVGIKAPSLYAFFESKEHIFLHIYRDIIASHLNLASSDAASPNASVRQQFEYILRMIMDYQLKESLQMKIYMRLLLFPPDVFQVDMKAELLKMEQAEYELFRAMFKRAMDSGEIKQADSDALAIALICMMDGLFWAMQRYDEARFQQHFRTVWEQFWQGIKQD